MVLPRENAAYGPPTQSLSIQLGQYTPEEKYLVERVNARRLALQGDMQSYRMRLDEIMRWVNPPWDPASKRIDPRPELATATRQGISVLHADLVSQVVNRWSALQAGEMFVFKVKPRPIRPPVDTGNQQDYLVARQQYDIKRAQAQDQSTEMENRTQEWLEANDFHRTLLWSSWSQEAFGKAILRSGWDQVKMQPTVELMENPSQVYYAWTNRYGARQPAWVLVADQMDPTEANALYGLNIPTDTFGNVDIGSWLGILDQSEIDLRAEQIQSVQHMIWAEEYWELIRDTDPDTGAARQYAMTCLIIAGRIVDGPKYYPWMTRLPFHVHENEHVLTYLHGKGSAEAMIPLNAAYDDALDREAQVIDFESGPRYKGINMANSGDETDIPDPFQLLPLREGEDIQQIDTRVDFFPAQTHMEELRQARYNVTGLTPIAWGMSPNAQTSGRAMASEWRAVELPLATRLINKTPELRAMIAGWWDYAEHFIPELKVLAHGGVNKDDLFWSDKPYRRFDVLWEPLDIREQSERTTDIVTRYNANLIDPETALDMMGMSNVDEIIAKIESYFLNPVWNPLRYQQYLTLQQMQLQIRMLATQVQQAEGQGQPQIGPGGAPGGAAPSPDQTAQGGAVAAAQGAQGPVPGSTGQNAPGGTAPGVLGGLTSQARIMNQPGKGGVQDRSILNLAGAGAAPPSRGSTGR